MPATMPAKGADFVIAAAASHPASPGQIILGLILIIAMIAAYWVPTFVACRRHVRNVGSIAVLNFFGFFVVTWVIALAMALADPRPVTGR